MYLTYRESKLAMDGKGISFGYVCDSIKVDFSHIKLAY